MDSLSPEPSSSPFPRAEGDNLLSGFVGIRFSPPPTLFFFFPSAVPFPLIFFKTSSRGPRGKFHPLLLQPERGNPPQKSIAVPLRGPCGGKSSYIPTPVGPLSRHAKEATNNLLGESPGGGEHSARRNVARPGYYAERKKSALERAWKKLFKIHG